jgi:hypothetical protein
MKKHFIQKKGEYKFEFEFGDDELIFKSRDNKSNSATPIPYAGISGKIWDFTAKNE